MNDKDLLREMMRHSGDLGQIKSGSVKPHISLTEIVRPPAPAGSGGAISQGGGSGNNSNQKKDSK